MHGHTACSAFSRLSGGFTKFSNIYFFLQNYFVLLMSKSLLKDEKNVGKWLINLNMMYKIHCDCTCLWIPRLEQMDSNRCGVTSIVQIVPVPEGFIAQVLKYFAWGLRSTSVYTKLDIVYMQVYLENTIMLWITSVLLVCS